MWAHFEASAACKKGMHSQQQSCKAGEDQQFRQVEGNQWDAACDGQVGEHQSDEGDAVHQQVDGEGIAMSGALMG